MHSGVGTDSAVILRCGRWRRDAGEAWRRRVPVLIILVAVLGWNVVVAEAAPAAKQGFAKAWQAYQAAVRRQAPPSELLPVARAVYDALPADPRDPKTQKRKAAAAFNLGAVLRDLHEEIKAQARFKESARLFEKALGKGAVELVDPLWEWARLALWLNGPDPRTAEKLVSRIDRILARHGPPMRQLRFDLHLEWATNFAKHGYSANAGDHLSWLEEHAQELGKPADYYLGEALFLRGKMAAARRHYEQALEAYGRARALLTKVLPPHDPRVLTVAQFAIVALEELGRSDEATPLCQEIGRYQKARAKGDYVPLYRALPEYPSSAVRRRQEGQVILALTVTAEGRTRDIRVVEADPPGVFERAAIEAVKKFRYAPRFVDGKPVDVKGVRYLFTFNIPD